MSKKIEGVEEIEVVEEVETTPRIAHDFLRTDLNELRDVVNELYREVKG